MVVDISHVKVGRYVHDFGVLYGKMGVVLGGVGVWGLGWGGGVPYTFLSKTRSWWPNSLRHIS